MARDAAFVREFARDRVQIVDLPAHTPRGPRGAAAGDRAGQLSRAAARPNRCASASPRRAPTASSALSAVKAAIGQAAGRAVHAQRLALRAVGSAGVASARWSSCSTSIGRCSWSRPIPGLVFSEVPLLRTARRRGVVQHGDRSELGQLHQQADPGAAGRSAGGLERHHEGAGDRAARLRRRRDSRRRRAAVRSALPRSRGRRARSSSAASAPIPRAS